MGEISESETPFPHRAGNIYKIQYSVAWKEESMEAKDHNLNIIRRIYDYMTPKDQNIGKHRYIDN